MANLITGVFLAERIDSEMNDDNRMQGVFKVQNQNLYGSEPSADCINSHRSSLRRRSVSESEAGRVFLAERINSKRTDADRMHGVFNVQNHNLLLLGSGPSTNCTNVHRSSLRR